MSFQIIAFVMKLVDILVLGTSAVRRAGSSPAEGKFVSVNLDFKRPFCLIVIKW